MLSDLLGSKVAYVLLAFRLLHAIESNLEKRGRPDKQDAERKVSIERSQVVAAEGKEVVGGAAQLGSYTKTFGSL